jgi:subtilisin family serine protease
MPDSKVIDPRIQRALRSHERGERDMRGLEPFARGSESDDLQSGEAEAPAAVPARTEVLVEFSEDKVPSRFAHLLWAKIADRIYAVQMSLDDIAALGQEPSVVFIEAKRTLGTMLDTSLGFINADHLPVMSGGTSPFDGSGVVVGIIDEGLDYTLDDFRDADGNTRIAFLWDQNLTPRAGTGERAPAEFGIGVEYDRNAINAALQHQNPFSAVRHVAEPASHGTHVAGIAVSNGRSHDDAFPAGKYVGAAPGATIIFVDPSRTGENENFTDSINVAKAVSYIFQRADQLGLPCVINMSLGTNGGSHDGESLVERAIDTLLQKKGRAFVKAAGNQHTSRGHASGQLRTGETRRIQWQVRFGDMTQNEVEIWYSSRDRFKARLISPTGHETNWVTPAGKEDVPNDGAGNAITIQSIRFTPVNGDALIYIELRRAGSAPIDHGIWIIELEALESHDGRFDAWIERDSRAHLSQFVDEDFDPVRTISLPGTVRYGIAVANCDHRAQPPVIATSSGRGTTRDGRLKPEIAAPGTDIVSSCSMGGRRSSGGTVLPVRVSMSGTSMAAPHVAGGVALLLQKNPQLSATQIRAILIASATRDPGSDDFRNDFGYGIIHAKRAMSLVE